MILRTIRFAGGLLVVLAVFLAGRHPLAAQAGASAPQVGTVKSIAGDSLTLATDQGQQVTIHIAEGARVVQLPAGSKSLADARPIDKKDIATGDRLLVRGTAAADSLEASSVIVMKQAEIEQKRRLEQQDWQKRGLGGLVASVDPEAGAITLTVGSDGAAKKVLVHVTSTTVLRRYAPGSVRFEDALPAALGAIRPGDQLRARGERNLSGGELTAEEIVSGTFKNIAGTIAAVDAASGEVTVKEQGAGKSIVLKVAGDSQLRRISQPEAQRLAGRLTGAGETKESADSSKSQRFTTPSADLQQALARLARVPLAELHSGEAVMVVAAPGAAGGEGTVITLLSGVEPILAAMSKGGKSISLPPWNLSGDAPSAP